MDMPVIKKIFVCLLWITTSVQKGPSRGPTRARYTCTRTTTDDVERWLQTEGCKGRLGALFDLCSWRQYSCVGRCGEHNENIGAPSMCSCDVICHVYKDCCFDVDDACPDVSKSHKERYSHVGDVDVTCVNDSPVIATCPENAINTSTHLHDPRYPVITETKTGLSFKNVNVFTCFHGREPTAQEAIPWERAIQTNGDVSITDLRKFLEDGVVIGDFNSTMQDTPPGQPTPRKCRSGVIRITCDDEDSLGECFGLDSICLEDVALVCQVLSGLHSFTGNCDGGMCTTLLTNTVSFPFDPTIQTTTAAAVIGVQASSEIEAPTHCHLDVEHVEATKAIKFKTLVSFEFMDFTPMSLQLGRVEPAPRWEEFRLEESYVGGTSGVGGYDGEEEEEEEDDKERSLPHYVMSIWCIQGYIFDGTDCNVPEQVTIKLSSVRYSDRFIKLIEYLISGIDAEYKSTMRLQPVSSFESTNSSFDILQVDFDIFDYRLTYKGFRLPITDYLIRLLRGYKDNDLGHFQITVCFVLNQNANIFLCDQIVCVFRCAHISHYTTSSDTKEHVSRWGEYYVANGWGSATLACEATAHDSLRWVHVALCYMLLILKTI